MKNRGLHIILWLVIACSHTSGKAQIKNVGIPFIINHSHNTYGAGTQNWAVAQSEMGFVYFGNNDGILEHDGRNWTLYPVSNASIVRSVLSVGDTIYAGAFEEIGFLAPAAMDHMAYHSLSHLIPESFRAFDEVWRIFKEGEKIIFQSFNYIFIYARDTMEVVEPISSFGLMHAAGGQYYVVDNETGLMSLENGGLNLISDHPVFFRNELRCVLTDGNGRLLIGTSNEGVFVWDGQTLSPWNTTVNRFLEKDILFSAIQLFDGNLAWGSISNGLFITSPDGDILQHLDRFKGLQNNTVLSIFEDRQKNLWLGLDYGIDMIDIRSPLTMINFNYNIETAYASIIHDDMLYIGTNQGLFALEASRIHNEGDHTPAFQLVEGTEGQVWDLSVIDGTLFCGHNFGCFVVSGYTARKISDIRGYWNFAQSPFEKDAVIAGTYSGLSLIRKKNNTWAFEKQIAGFDESCRKIHFDKQNSLWVSHGYRGLYRLRFPGDHEAIAGVDLFQGDRGLPASLPYNIQVIDQNMFVTTHQGIYAFDYEKESFHMPEHMNRLFESKAFIDKIYEDKHRNLWYFTSDYMGLMRRLEDGTFSDIRAPFSGITDYLLPAFQNIFVSDDQDVWIGSRNGLIHYKMGLVRDFNYAEDVFIREATFVGARDSIFIPFPGRDDPHIRERLAKIPFGANSARFTFTIPSYEKPGKIRFSYRLKGFNNHWSDWDEIHFKEFTNLREGQYVFEVKAMNSFGNESHIQSIDFYVSPPFVRSRTAYTIYALLFLALIALNTYLVRRRIKRIKQQEKSESAEKIAAQEQLFREQSLISEKEIIRLRNESLKSEMNYKNRELANATLHLIQKNRTLTSLKNDLNKIIKTGHVDTTHAYLLNNLTKKINKDIRNEQNWELFNTYFDEVHQDFINRLKEKYEDLSPKELRLCAYLRMNISTKEIAPLMNISVRGVEISRYRLRKKLQLAHDTNLTEFLMSF